MRPLKTTRAGGRAAAALLITLLLTVLAGCGGDSSPKSSRSPGERDKPLTAGTCWDDEQLPEALGQKKFADWVTKYASGNAVLGDAMRDDAAFDKQVDCAKRHSLELYNVVELGPALTAKVTKYADLLDQTSPLYHRVRDQVNERCLAQSPYGVAQRKAGGLPVQLGPSLNPAGGLHVAWDPFPADLWAKGQKKFVCTFEQDEPGTLLFADVTTDKVPLAARICMNTPGTNVPCSGKHQAEDIAEMILNTAIEKGQINGRKAIRRGADGKFVALSPREYARLDKTCQTLLTSVSTRKGITARAYPGDVSQWPSKAGVYVAICYALRPGTRLPMFSGSVFDKS